MNATEKHLQPIRRPTTDVRITTVRNGTSRARPDVIATEEPMEIRIHGPHQESEPITVTMRTPGNDFELAIGLLYNEGIVASKGEIKTICYCADVEDPEQQFNVVTVELYERYRGTHKDRSFYSSSACGVCGTSSIQQLALRAPTVTSSLSITTSTLVSLPKAMKPYQKIFDKTGGLHGVGIFSSTGNLEIVREDIGRHNALDKAIGHYFLEEKLPLNDKVLALSGRIGFELVQKAAVAQIPIIVAVSAPSSLAVKTAQDLGITLVGFVREDSANIYTHPERIIHEH